MRPACLWTCVISTLIVGDGVLGDLYAHNPRGSNNRLNEKSATRTNGNRMFDSQNNARGGYNVGDEAKNAANNEDQQYRMRYFQSGVSGHTELQVEWTNQHGCGGDENTSPHKLNCNMVLQFMCQPNEGERAPDDSITLRNGRQTQTQTYQEPSSQTETKQQTEQRRNNNVQSARGLHESWEWYDACYLRERNQGLFTADQLLQNNRFGVKSAISTRQNPNKNRRGYECPEERDYYPYWHPTPWVDVAVLAHNASWCSYYKEHSFNREPKSECVETFGNGNTGARKHWSTANNPESCAAAGGTWTEYHNYLELAPELTTEQACNGENNRRLRRRGVVYKWGKPYDQEKIVKHQSIDEVCFVQPPEVDCKAAEWSRVNHLGNGRDGTPLNYTWVLPHFPSLQEQRCVFRIRYNMSTDDYAPWSVDASKNQVKQNNVVVQRSPIEQNPLVNIGAHNQLLRLAINTAQTGRVFQDRSHVFIISPRPTAIADNVRIVNLNVRGKRGNIVQTFPAVEYDFIPNRMHIDESDLVHLQWTGSNTHNNNAPGGDGQTGDAGEGKGGTDRHNFLELLDPSENFPRPYENSTFFQNMNVLWNSIEGDYGKTPEEKLRNIAIQMASSGYYRCARSADCRGESIDTKAQLNPTLDTAPASYPGLVFSLKRGVYYYVCTRNNSFTNRSQKGHIKVAKD